MSQLVLDMRVLVTARPNWATPGSGMGNFRDQLASDGRGRIAMSFAEVDAIVGGLPRSARVYRAWWANEVNGRHFHAHAWQQAGCVLQGVDLSAERVTARRER